MNNQPRQFVVGNETDWGVNSFVINGHLIDGANFITGKKPTVVAPENIQLTDFTIYPTEDYQYGAGTEVYYPLGVTGMGYPFLGIYDKATMALISIEYFDLSYPGIQDPANAIGLRVIYSREAQSFYISGVMADQLFADINMNNIQGKSKAFIMKIDALGLANPQVLIFDPDNLPDPQAPLICVVTDLEISGAGTEIAFTGMTTTTDFAGNYNPMVGTIDLNLNLQWCNVYNFPIDRYSGVDVEYNTANNNLFVLLNSSRYPFAVMELNNNGTIKQQPVKYEFSDPLSIALGSTRAHKMHYNNGAIMITGNCFVDGATSDQLLFSYNIPTASNLMSGNNTFNSYSRELVPLGSQKAVTGYWAPENSIYQNGNLSIVGIYNNNNQTFGYTLIQVNGFVNDPGCLEIGDVALSTFNTESAVREAHTDYCNRPDFLATSPPDPPVYTQECPSFKNSATGMGDGTNDDGNFCYFKGIDAQGIHAVLVSENSNTVYNVNVYDVVGRKIFSSTYKVSEGQKEIHLVFDTKAEMYIISVSNGSQTETLKVMGNR
ncbi:MAG: hypothetical protein COW63_12885 [Bacteroidetes bacterium CG18_big_fil_WC_8_21_14_2_50_41_14]|nr:MAG: hypothetical protein COW63_12885 [Bacteroidetes bacterium CG18_big_fil_WC_8_21_14_2_50_41_14]